MSPSSRLAASFFACAAVLLASGALADDLSRLSVAGFGEARAAPDIATITVGVETRADTAEAALAENSTDAASLIEAAKERGVADADIQTSGLNIYPVFEQQQPGRREAPTVAGYSVSNSVSLRIRDLDALGATLTALVAAGANQMRGISFGIEDDEALRDEARRLAVADARRKAELYAEAAGVTLGPIISISEGGGGGQPGPLMRSMAEAAPVEAGENAVSARVNVVWRIETE